MGGRPGHERPGPRRCGTGRPVCCRRREAAEAKAGRRQWVSGARSHGAQEGGQDPFQVADQRREDAAGRSARPCRASRPTSVDAAPDAHGAAAVERMGERDGRASAVGRRGRRDRSPRRRGRPAGAGARPSTRRGGTREGSAPPCGSPRPARRPPRRHRPPRRLGPASAPRPARWARRRPRSASGRLTRASQCQRRPFRGADDRHRAPGEPAHGPVDLVVAAFGPVVEERDLVRRRPWCPVRRRTRLPCGRRTPRPPPPRPAGGRRGPGGRRRWPTRAPPRGTHPMPSGPAPSAVGQWSGM